MNMASVKMACLTSILGLAIQLNASVAGAAAVSFSAASLQGRWGLQMMPAKSFASTSQNLHGDSGNVAGNVRQNLLRVGVITWDSATAVVGHLIAVTDDNAGNTIVIDYGFTGTYTVNFDGTGTLSITPSVTDLSCTPAQAPGFCATFETPETYAISITRNRGVKLVQTVTGGQAKVFMQGEALQQVRSIVPPVYTPFSLRRTWAFVMEPNVSFAANNPSDLAGVGGAPRQDVIRVGQLNFDGFGGVIGHAIATTDDNTGNSIVIDYNFAGTYTINADGTGTMNITPSVTDSSCNPAQGVGVCATFEGAEAYELVIIPKRGRIYLIQTDNVGGGAKIFMAGEGNFQ